MVNGEAVEAGKPVGAGTTPQERDLLWEKLVYTCRYLDQREIHHIILLDYIFLMGKAIRALVAVNALAYVMLLVFTLIVRNFELSLIAGLGVGFLSGATFVIWIVKDVLPRSKK